MGKYKMFVFVKQVFVSAMIFFSCNVLNLDPLKCVSMGNQECRARPEIKNIKSNKPLFYHYSILVNRCSGSCKNIDDPFAKLCVPDNRKRWNNEKCWCECKELIDKGIWYKGFIWNPSNCECECDKSYGTGEYLQYENC